MSRRAALLITASALLYASAAWTAGTAPRAPQQWARELVRPLVLPFLWRSLADAERRGTVGEQVEKGRLLMELLPRWADGHIVFSYRLVLQTERQPGAALARLQAALSWMDTARTTCPEEEIELLTAMAFLIELAADRNEALAAELRDQGTPAPMWADDILEQAERLSGSATVRERRIFAAPRLIGHFLRLRDDRGARAIVDQAIARLPEVRDRELAARWEESLGRLRLYLLGDRRVDREVLMRDPLLASLTPYLE